MDDEPPETFLGTLGEHCDVLKLFGGLLGVAISAWCFHDMGPRRGVIALFVISLGATFASFSRREDDDTRVAHDEDP